MNNNKTHLPINSLITSILSVSMERYREEEGDCFHEATVVGRDATAKKVRVPVAQELARQGLKFLPERFIQVHSRICSHGESFSLPMFIPSISMAKLGQQAEPSVRAQELAQLARCAKEWGVFLVREHGINPSVFHGVKEVVQGFFRLTFEEKRASVGSYPSVDNMGYGRNFVKSEDQVLDWIDRLAMKAAPKSSADEELAVWPQKPPNFRIVMEKYVEEARKLGDHLLQAIAEALSLNPHAFIQSFDPGSSEINVRVNYYPPCPEPELALGITPHSDASALTLLIQFGCTGGLQLLKGQNWVTVPWPCNELLVVAGDLLEIMSDGRLKSPWHRVVAMGTERLSVALFYNPPCSTEIEPVVGGDGSYRKVVVGDYLRHFYEISPVNFEKQAMAYAKK